MSDKQRTLKQEVKFQGVGLHTGEIVNMTVKPAPANHGYKFQRIDLEKKPIIKADPDNVVSTERGTTLEQNGGKVYTTEHILAAIYGLEIDNALIEVDAPEIPIMDGSSASFCMMLNEAGIRKQDAYDPAKFKYTRAFQDLPMDYTHIVTVVKFGWKKEAPYKANNFVLTTYLVKKRW